jgi:hypothetical protein
MIIGNNYSLAALSTQIAVLAEALFVERNLMHPEWFCRK